MSDPKTRPCTCGALWTAVPWEEKRKALRRVEMNPNINTARQRFFARLQLAERWFKEETGAVERECICHVVQDPEAVAGMDTGQPRGVLLVRASMGVDSQGGSIPDGT